MVWLAVLRGMMKTGVDTDFEYWLQYDYGVQKLRILSAWQRENVDEGLLCVSSSFEPQATQT